MLKSTKKTGPEAIMNDFYAFICERVAEGLCDANKDGEYQETLEKLDQLWQAAKPLIRIDLFLELDAVINGLNTIEYDYIYRRGFFDALDFLKCGNIPLSYTA